MSSFFHVSIKLKKIFLASDTLQQNKSGPWPKGVGNHRYRWIDRLMNGRWRTVFILKSNCNFVQVPSCTFLCPTLLSSWCPTVLYSLWPTVLSAIEAGAPGGEAAEGRYLSVDASSFVQMVESAEKRLFRAIVTNPSHLLQHALPEKSPPSTTCALEPTTLSYRGRTLGTFWPISCTLTSTVPNSLRLRL